MVDDSLKRRLRNFLTESEVKKVLEEVSATQSSAPESQATLTIVANQGVHYIDSGQLKGEIVYASKGQLDQSSSEAIHRDYCEALTRIAKVVKTRHWEEIYLLPTGPVTLSLNIKALVRQITGKDTIDLFTDKVSGEVWNIHIDIRNLVSDAAD